MRRARGQDPGLQRQCQGLGSNKNSNIYKSKNQGQLNPDPLPH